MKASKSLLCEAGFAHKRPQQPSTTIHYEGIERDDLAVSLASSGRSAGLLPQLELADLLDLRATDSSARSRELGPPC